MSGDSPQLTATETRKLAAIMFTDIVGFSRQMGSDEARMLRLLDVHNQLIQQVVTLHHGHVIKTIGDAFLVDFPSVVHAVQCAQAIQAQFKAHNTDKEKAEQIHVRIGIHLGDIVQKDGDVFGDGVNIASRLQSLAEPDTICISDIVYRDVAKKVDLGTVISLGKPKLKNIAERFPVYALLPESPKGIRQTVRIQSLKFSRRVRPAPLVATAGLLLIAGTLITARYVPILLPNSPPLTPNTQPLPLPDKPSIVVLPFTNLSNDPSQDYFSDGITEDITTDLSKIASLFVIARNSAFTYKGKAVKVQDVSREMGVRYVLEGSVRKADNKVRVTAQLIDGLTGSHVWAERYDRPLKEILAVQDEVVQKIVTTLNLQLSLWEQGLLVRKRTESLEAYDFFLRGWKELVLGTKETNAEARLLFKKSLELDPSYAEAYSALGQTYYWEWWSQWNLDPQNLDQAFALAQKARDLNDTFPAVHLLLCGVYAQKGQHEQALAEARRIIALVPNSALGYAQLGTMLNFAGRPEEALPWVKQAMRLDPRSPIIYLWTLGQTYRLMGRYEEAITAQKKVLSLYPNYLPAHVHLASIYSELGLEREAQAEATAILRLSPGFSIEAIGQRLPYRDPIVLERFLAALRKAGLK